MVNLILFNVQFLSHMTKEPRYFIFAILQQKVNKIFVVF